MSNDRSRHPGSLRKQLTAAVIAGAVAAAGFWAKFGAFGRFTPWVHAHLAGTFYVMFWILLVYAAAPTERIWLQAALVTAGVCALECLQAVRGVPGLDALRRTFWGGILLGRTFDWLDFPYYLLGGAAGAGAACAVRRFLRKAPHRRPA